MKHTNECRETSTAVDFWNARLQQRPLSAIFLFQILILLCLFSNRLMDFCETSHKWLIYKTFSPTAAVAIFIWDFVFIMLIFKSVWWIRCRCVLKNKVFLILLMKCVWCVALTALYFVILMRCTYTWAHMFSVALVMYAWLWFLKEIHIFHNGNFVFIGGLRGFWKSVRFAHLWKWRKFWTVP